MKTMKSIRKKEESLRQKAVSLAWVCLIMLAGLFTSCDGSGKATESEDVSQMTVSTAKAPASLPYSGNLVEVRTEHMNFIMPEEIPSGWTTFRYHNESTLTHFISLDIMPVVDGEQKTIVDFGEVAPVFVDAMDLINAGKAEEGFAEFNRLPAWFPEIVFWGGVGLVSAGETAQTTLYLDPGVYVAECYVKTAGKFHPMAKQFIVTEETTSTSPPEPTLNLTISKEGGIEIDKDVTPGLHTIAVHFKDQTVHENFMGHDVHLAKVRGEQDLAALNGWMNWADPQGLNTPAPATFLGGVQQMPEGNTAYFTVQLEPGFYALVSEVPSPASKGLLKAFRVPAENTTASLGAK